MDTAVRSPRHLAAPSWQVRQWRLWTQPRVVVCYVLCVELIALALAIPSVVTTRPDSTAVGRFVVLAGLALLYAEATTRIERLRRYLGDSHVVVASVWLFAAVMALPVGLAYVLTVLVYGHRLTRRKRIGASAYRVVFNGASVIIVCQATSATIHALADVGPRWGVSGAAGVLVYDVVNFGLVALAVTLAEGRLSGAMHSGDEHLFALAELCLGAATGLILVHQPWLSWVTLPVMLVLQRSAAVRQLQVQAVTDAKTGLLNPTAWQQLAQRQLAQAVRGNQPASLLLIDLDHFKRINDTYGHLAGDDVLRRVADTVKRELREYDSVGRFGGEEFVAFLPGVDLATGGSIAERLRHQIAGLRIDAMAGLDLSASIGVAAYERRGAEIDELLRAADEALYAAKRGGRNRVEVAAGVS